MPSEISEISSYLDRFAPTVLVELRVQHPDAGALFSPSGVSLGSEPPLQPALDAAVAMLKTVDDVASAAVAETLNRLARARRLQLIGSVLSLVSSGGVIGAILGFNADLTAAGLAVVGFLASAVPLVVAWLRGTTTGASVEQSFVKLRELTWDARVLLAESSRGSLEQKGPDFLTRVNGLAREIYVVLGDLGYDPRFRPI